MLKKFLTYIVSAIAVASATPLLAATSSSQNIVITLIGESLIALEIPSLEVIFASSDGITQEKTVSSPYEIVNIGATVDVVGRINILPLGIKIFATLGVPDNIFSDAQPSSIPDVELNLSDQLSLKGVGKQYGSGVVSYRVSCDFSIASISELQSFPITVTYTMEPAIVS